MNFKRKQNITDYQENGRVLLVYGPRRVGKTTMIKEYLRNCQTGLPAPEIGTSSIKVKYDVGDDLTLQKLFNSQICKDILEYAKPYDVIALDEAHQIKSIGMASKIIIDEFKKKKIVLTGSSSFELAQNVGEPLVGRQYIMHMMPVSFSELEGSLYEKKQYLQECMIYGMYPEIVLADDNHVKQEKLAELVSSYLFKDIFSFERLKSPNLLLDITQALAFQIGSEVSLQKLTKDVGETDHKKVGRYVELLEKAFIIKKVTAYSTNLRKELRTPVKYYFYDLGVRNAIIRNFNSLENRSTRDLGGMFENFVFMELYKKSIIERRSFAQLYFWRNKKGKELDIVETDLNNKITAFECKWREEKVSFNDFLEQYPHAETNVITSENIVDFVG